MWKSRIVFSIVSLLCFSSQAQQLIINEVSQGANAKEYVEFVVIGTPTCQTPVPCIDLRGVIIDDNNGFFAPGGGTGIASGAIRFANISFWSCVPQGTYIVVYNESDVNGALPPDDVNLSDGNCRLIIPANSNLLEGTSTSPNTSVSTYPAGGWTLGGGSWNQVAMSNANDSFQIPNLGVNGTPLHSVSWGNNTSGAIIYFAGSAASKVFSFTNNTSNDWNLQANWTSGDVGVNETPGDPNNAANDAWIASMNPQCGIAAGLNVTVSSTVATCFACNAVATATVSGGVAPYTYNWSNGSINETAISLCGGTTVLNVTDAAGCSTTIQVEIIADNDSLVLIPNSVSESCEGECNGIAGAYIPSPGGSYDVLWSNGETSYLIDSLCPGTYSVSMSNILGCSGSISIVIEAGLTADDPTIQLVPPLTTTSSSVQLQSQTSGGIWSTNDCVSCLSNDGIFDPQSAGVGTFQICYQITAPCPSSDCIEIVVTNGCSPQTTEEVMTFCAEDSVLIFGNWENTPDTYSQTFTDINGCDSTHNVILLVIPIFNNQTVSALCYGDSVLVFGQWVTEAGDYTQEQQTPQGCNYTFHHIVVDELPQYCENEEFSLFVPNAFTPDGDFTNDTFRVELLGGKLEEGYIFNRWGNEIKRFDNENREWDGKTTSGEPVQDGVYTYVLFYTPTNKTRETVHGFVTVIR
jgi:gliding motility-associated-like protein